MMTQMDIDDVLMDVDDLRAFILRAARVLTEEPTRAPDNLGDPLLDRKLEILIEIFRGLAMTTILPPIPDMLPFLGRPGRLLRAVACQTPGCWAAILVVATRVYPELGALPPVIRGEELAESYAERLVLRAVSQMAGITPPELHPQIVGLARDPDLLVRAQNGRAALVEVAGLIESDSAADRSPAEREYRARLPSRLRDYETFDRQCRAQGATAYGPPVLIFRDELAPRPLWARLNEVRLRLDLDLRPPPPPFWFET